MWRTLDRAIPAAAKDNPYGRSWLVIPDLRQRPAPQSHCIELAAETGIRTVQLAGYDVYYEESNERTLELFKEGLRQGIVWAERMNVMLAVEIMDTELINSVAKGMKYVREFNSHCFKVYPDIGNISGWEENDIEADLEAGKNE